MRAAVFSLILATFASGCASVNLFQVRSAADARLPDSPVLRKALRSPDVNLRAAAARAMGQIQSPSYSSALIAALGDADRNVRFEAAFALGQIGMEYPGPAEPDVRMAVWKAVSDADAGVRAAAVEAVGKTGGPGMEPKLAELLIQGDPASRREAALALFRLRHLGRITDFSQTTVEALMEGLTAGEEEVRWRSAYALSRWPEPRAAAALSVASRQGGLWQRLFALRALAQLGPLAPVAEAKAALADGDEKIRTEAYGLLKAAGRGDLVPPASMKDPSLHARAAAASALGGSKAELALLEAFTKDPSPFVRGQAALRSAEVMKEGFAPALAKHATDEHWWVRSRAMLGAAFLAQSAMPLLQKGLRDFDVRVRSAALEAVGKRQDTEATGFIARALLDPMATIEMRGTAVEAVITRREFALFDPLRKAYFDSQGREFIELRESVVDAAAAIAAKYPNHPEILYFQEQLLSDPAPSVRLKAARAMGRPPKPLPFPEISPYLSVPLPKENTLTFETEKGSFVVELAPDQAPIHVTNIVQLARRDFYDSTRWHRMVPNFVVQGGDPFGTGWGDAGISLRDEVNPLKFDRGTVGMPKAGKDTGGCQLFVTLVPTPHLDGRYTVFGRVIKGMEVVDRIEPGDRILHATAR